MEQFNSLVSIIDTLLGPKGCPWDKEQTFLSLQPFLLEEVHEVIEAIDQNHTEHLIEELGDLLFIILFYAKIAEKMNQFELKDILIAIEEKLICRHPHVFAEESFKDAADVLNNWERIKAAEKKKKGKEQPTGKIPDTLPLLTRAQKVIGRLLRKDPKTFDVDRNAPCSEEEIAQELIGLIAQAESQGIDVEGALRRTLSQIE